MKLHLDWLAPIQLTNGADQNLIYHCDPESLPTGPGIYIFGRRHGESTEALYVGKANSIRSRVKGQLNNLPLMMHLKNARSGNRILLVGRFLATKAQQRDKCLPIIERAMIRYLLSEAHDLANIQGTALRQHEIISAGIKRVIPGLMFAERHAVDFKLTYN